MRSISECRIKMKRQIERTDADDGRGDRNETDQAPPIQMVRADLQNNTTEHEADTAIIRTNICFHGVRGTPPLYSSP